MMARMRQIPAAEPILMPIFAAVDRPEGDDGGGVVVPVAAGDGLPLVDALSIDVAVKVRAAAAVDAEAFWFGSINTTAVGCIPYVVSCTIDSGVSVPHQHIIQQYSDQFRAYILAQPSQPTYSSPKLSSENNIPCFPLSSTVARHRVPVSKERRVRPAHHCPFPCNLWGLELGGRSWRSRRSHSFLVRDRPRCC